MATYDTTRFVCKAVMTDEHGGDGARLYSIREACDVLSIGRTTLFDLIKVGAIRTVTIGNRRLISSYAIADFIHGLEVEQS